MAGTGDEVNAGGGPARHIPVLLNEVLSAVDPASGKRIIDGTFGGGGYTREFLRAGATVIAIDRDPAAIAAGSDLKTEFGPQLDLVHGAFSQLDAFVEAPVDAVVLDVGVSSMQLDQPERGFSFRGDGPLDMRMGQSGISAADIVNTAKAGDLARIFTVLGEERHAGRIARMIENRRRERPFETTGDLATAIEKSAGHSPRDKIHPATRAFQALRIFVNDELGELARALFAAETVLKPEGVLAVVTFHSLEDRIVKRFIADRSSARAGSRHMPEKAAILPSFRKAGRAFVTPRDDEVAANPRARSAKLRVALRTENPPLPKDDSFLRLPRISGQTGLKEV
jgi:16S rRNA (cytosine1402-N4)-methyltransferase